MRSGRRGGEDEVGDGGNGGRGREASEREQNGCASWHSSTAASLEHKNTGLLLELHPGTREHKEKAGLFGK